MIKIDDLIKINSSVRQQILALEEDDVVIKAMEAGNAAESKVKQILADYLSTVLSSLFLLSDFLFEAEIRIKENDLEWFIKEYNEGVAERKYS